MPSPPDSKTTALAWVSATSELALSGAQTIRDGIQLLPAQTIRDGIQLLPAPIRRELTRHVVELSGYPPRRTGTTPPPKPERPAPKPDGRGRSRPAEAHPAAAAPAGPPRAVAKVASPTRPWGTAAQPNYAEEDTSAPPPPPAHPTSKMPRPTARTEEEQPKTPATPDDDDDEEDVFCGFERCCTYRHPPAQFYAYYPKCRDEDHFRRRAERIKHDLEQPSAQSLMPWVPPELYALQFNELDDVLELEKRQAASDHAPPITAATDAASTSAACPPGCRARGCPTGRTRASSPAGAHTRANPAAAAKGGHAAASARSSWAPANLTPATAAISATATATTDHKQRRRVRRENHT